VESHDASEADLRQSGARVAAASPLSAILNRIGRDWVPVDPVRSTPALYTELPAIVLSDFAILLVFHDRATVVEDESEGIDPPFECENQQ
jgi:hypothetical protein